MPMKPGYTNINKDCPLEMHKRIKTRYRKFPEFWKELGQLYAAVVGKLTKEDWESIKEERMFINDELVLRFDDCIEFVEECL